MDDLIYKAEVEAQTHREEMYRCQGGKWVGGVNCETGIDIYTLLCIK